MKNKLMKILSASVILSIPLTINSIQYPVTSYYLNKIECEKGKETARDEAKRLIGQNKTLIDYVFFGGVNLSAKHYLSDK